MIFKHVFKCKQYIPVQFVERFAFGLVVQVRAFVQRMLAGEHGSFDKWFDHFPLRLVLAPERFVASPEIVRLVAMLQLVVPEHFVLFRFANKGEKKMKKNYFKMPIV